MIDQQKLPGYVEKTLPEVSDMCNKNACDSTYDIVKQMLKYTKSQVGKHNMDAAGNCLQMAENLYKKGNRAIKNAIENVYVYSFSHAFFHDEAKKKDVMKIVPATLYDLYKKQVIYSHL